MIRWTEPQVSTISQIVHNPAFAGIYAFRRRVNDVTKGRDDRGRKRSRKARPDERIEMRDHHEGYITEEQFEEIQRILKLNGPSKARRNAGPGSALLQGIMRCGLHRNWAMCPTYKEPRKDGGQSHTYYCIGDCHQGGKQCGRIPGAPVDSAVVEAVLQKLQPVRVESIREAWRQARADDRAEQNRQRTEANRARQRVDDLELRYLSVDPSNRLVARDLEAKLEAAKRDLAQLEQRSELETSPITLFDESGFTELAQLCADFRSLWNAPTTSHLDRKQILRTLIENVILVDKNAERVVVRIVWVDGSPDTTIEAVLNRHGRQMILALRSEGLDAQEIARRLNQAGIPTSKGNPWTKQTVAQFLRRHAS